jgi:serine/threonine protein kinase
MKAPTSHGNARAGSSTGDHLEDLRREVDIMRALNHPNLVKLYEVIDDKVSGKILMVVEFCEAGALVSPGQLTPERRMPEAIAQFYFRQMVSGIAYLHERNVIHGDMKPENVLLAGDATVKIADFGQSQFMSGGEDTLRRTLGTPAFLAPEICAGEDYRGRPADIWALGVSLYGFTYGELPFKGDSLMELYEDIANATVPFPPSVAVSMELQDLLLRALHKDPEARITAAEMLTHPWVREDDLFTLMPSLFSDEAMMEGAGVIPFGGFGAGVGGFGDGAAVSPRPLSPRLAAGAGASGSDAGGDGDANSSVHDSNRAASDASSLPMSVGAPSPADVAAAVFPSLFSMRRKNTSNSSGHSSGKRKGIGGGVGGDADKDSDVAFMLGPQSSIIGALQQAHAAPNKLGAHPSERLHYLGTDSMVRRSLDRIDSEEDVNGGDEAGGSSNSRKSSGSGGGSGKKKNIDRQDTGRPASFTSTIPGKYKREKPKMEALAEGDDDDDSAEVGGNGGSSDGSNAQVGNAEERHQVELSKPSAFTVMAQQAQKVQAELLAKKKANETTATPTVAGGGPSSRAMSVGLETIGEEESEDLNASSIPDPFSSMMSLPSGSYEIIDAPLGHSAEPPEPEYAPLPSITESEDSGATTKQKRSIGILGKKKSPAMAIPSSHSSGLTEITWTTSSGVQQSSQSLTFGYGSAGGDSLPIASPFDTMEPSPSPPSFAFPISSGDGDGGAKESNTAAVNTTNTTTPPSTKEGDNATNATTPAAAVCEIEEEEGTDDPTTSTADIAAGALPSSSALKGSNRVQNFLQRLSFKGAVPPDEESDPAASSTAPGGGPTKAPPPPLENEPPAIQWKMYRPGQKLQFQMSTHNQNCTNTVYYIESGMIELRWEASLAVPLTRVLSTMQHPSRKYSTATSNNSNASGGSGGSVPTTSRPTSANESYMNRIDSVALAANKVTTLRPASAGSSNNSRDNGGPTSGMDRSETMANTLQQAAERAEALMVNATGGSLDNLLLSHRGASQFVGALSMLDPDYFADRWKASAIAQTELVVIQMTRAGLDDFLSQNPLAQVHLRASMARGQAEITKLEALERIADAQRKKRYPKQTVPKKGLSFKMSDLKGAFGVTIAEAAEAVGLATGADMSRLGTMRQGRDGDANAQETAGLDVFALVSKLRRQETQRE